MRRKYNLLAENKTDIMDEWMDERSSLPMNEVGNLGQLLTSARVPVGQLESRRTAALVAAQCIVTLVAAVVVITFALVHICTSIHL